MDEFNVKLAPNTKNKKYNVFKLHKDDQVAWNEAKMRRENDYQPWQIRFGTGKTARRFKAIKEGGVGDNASYFVFYKSNDKSDTYEVCPVDEWYSVSATQRYKTLTAEEAEELFEKRDKMFNFASVMKKSGDNDEDGPTGSDTKNFKVSELDEWGDSGDDDRSDDDDGDGDEGKKKKGKKKNIKKEEEEAPEEGKEDSDEGDFEQREVDYMSDISSDSSVSETDRKDENDVKGIGEEQALRDFVLGSEDEEEEDADNPQRKTVKSRQIKRENDENGSDDSSDSDDFDVDEDKMDTILMKKALPAQLSNMKKDPEQQQQQQLSQQQQQQQSQQQQQLSASVKRKVSPDTAGNSTSKRPCVEVPANSQEKLVEDLIRKYLSRKPMTLKILLKEIRNKLRRMEGMPPEMDGNLVNMIASIMKRIGPDKQKINDLLYFSIKN